MKLTKDLNVVFFRSKVGWRNWFIRKWTGSDIVHAELQLSDGSFIGICPDDIGRVRRTSKVRTGPEDTYEVIELKLSKDHNTLNIVNDQIGGPTPARDIARACMEIAKQLILDPTKSGKHLIH